MIVEKTVLLPVSADEAFALITQPDRLRRWLAVSARVDLRAGGQFRWTLTPMAVAAGTVIEVEPGRRIVLGFDWEPSGEPRTDTVTITIEPAEGGTLVRLVHEDLPEDQGNEVLEGWTHFFERLERAAAAGDAGPDEWTAAPAHLDPLTSANATLAVLQHVLHGIGEDDLSKPTPCTAFTVGQLEAHLLGSLSSLTSLAGSTLTPASAGDLESRIADAAQQAVETWMRRGLGGTVQAGRQELPASIAASILSVEFLVHAWDFASATGQKVAVSDKVSTYVLGLAEQIVTPELRESAGFDPAIPISATAPALDRLVAFSGRAG
ncbi:TIGR03086 family protein [Micromonospora sp. Llam7]|uniref:TIGR03086 family metal-binding protein n=1 Tax=Micromonospora tarapacensis TaxID=2835305 RepID=UPI001C83F906|nr:TIGR03086 family metal-binding protein [Micromonospora tarapacensis]MBX7266241.1 TIGR03086 family protein [Micromonospora tarapacensis]